MRRINQILGVVIGLGVLVACWLPLELGLDSSGEATKSPTLAPTLSASGTPSLGGESRIEASLDIAPNPSRVGDEVQIVLTLHNFTETTLEMPRFSLIGDGKFTTLLEESYGLENDGVFSVSIGAGESLAVSWVYIARATGIAEVRGVIHYETSSQEAFYLSSIETATLSVSVEAAN